MRALTRRGDRGAVLVLLALSMTVLMIFAAFAVDIGAARSARRKAQGTVDASALGGGQLLLTADGARTAANGDEIADEAIELAFSNFTGEPAMTDSVGLSVHDWRTEFASCNDPDRDLSRFPIRSTISECISFNNPITRVRVRLPDLDVPTYFAGIMGISELHTRADAEVELVPTSSGGLLPFGLPGASGGATMACLKSGSQPVLPPCDGPETGNFGTINLRFYGNPVLGTPEVCNGEETLRLMVNIALGVDHRLSTYTTGTPVNERASCPDLALRPNQVDGRPGFTAQTLDNGLIEGTSLDGHPIPGRLTSGPWATREARRGSPRLDDRPLWQFLDPDLTTTDAPAECVPSLTTITSRAAMDTCLQLYLAGGYTGELFAADLDGTGGPDLLQSPRMAWIPQFHELAWTTGRSEDYEIASFRPVFLQTVYFACTPGGGCSGIFDPGETGSGLPVAHNKNAEALTAFVLTDDMLPQAVLDRGPTGPAVYDLVLRR